MEKLIFKSYADLVNDIKNNIHKLSDHNFDLVVGIPRSGMIPAYLISAYLNLDCCDIDALINDRPLQRGITRTTKKSLTKTSDAKKILLVDDSVYSGKSIKQAISSLPDKLKQKVTTLAIYSSTKDKKIVDYYFEFISGKKLFEWGIYHNNIISNTCIDIDGVICQDPLVEENDDGERYLNFIRHASPKFLPTGEIYALVSNRLEKYRLETEAWLSKHDVKYKKLILLDLPNKEDRLKIDCGIEHKGHFYKKSSAELFIESSFIQSISIAETSGKPVYCVEKNVFITPEMTSVLRNNGVNLLKLKYYRIKHLLKPYLGWLKPNKKI